MFRLPQTAIRYFTSSLRGQGPREIAIQAILGGEFAPSHLEVMNESYMHSVPKNSETHFKVIIVSNEFNGMRTVARHRKVNQLLKAEFDSGLHALSILPYTPQEWDSVQSTSQGVPKSPGCLGGSKKEKEQTESSPTNEEK